MKLLKLMMRLVMKAAAAPIMCLAFLVQLIGSLLIGCSAWVFRILAFLCALTAVLCWLMGLEEAPAVWRMLAGAFVIFLIPMVGEGIVGAAGFVAGKLMGFIIS